MINKDLYVKHREICQALSDLYNKKNTDYDDAFHKSFEEFGLPMAYIRIGDKLNRVKGFMRECSPLVKDETLEDTLMDLANYAIMTIIELQRMPTDIDSVLNEWIAGELFGREEL